MRRFLYFLFSSCLILSFTACAPDSREQGVPAVTTHESPKPVIVEEKGYRIARGATNIQDMSVNYDPQTKSMRLKGKIEYLAESGGIEKRSIDLSGVQSEDGYVVLKDQRREAPNGDKVRVAAKATCLSEGNSCFSSFIDIYIHSEGLTYHHQIESHQKDEKAAEGAEPKKDSVKKSETETPANVAVTEEDIEFEGGSDGVDGEPGQYIGSVTEDIEKILGVTPKEDPKKDSPAKDEPPKAEPPAKKDTPPAPRKDPPAKEDPKKNPPKAKEDPKDDEPKKSEPVPKPVMRNAIQAVGQVGNGRLQNAIDLYGYEKNHANVGFEIIRPKRLTHFATNELTHIMLLMGKFTRQNLPEQKLYVGDLSREKGGKLGSHLSHQTGLDVDVAFYFDNKTFFGRFASAVAVDKPHGSWLPEVQWRLFKEVVQTKYIDRIFIHATLKKSLCELAIKNGELQKDTKDGVVYETLRRLIPEKDHHNHFHLRVKCSSAQALCRQMAEPVNSSGCF
ncbi:MAG: penicillin-insensitive murein endopeptidase [Bdellovibrio sp.]|nr:penicillin-insensitive murein endopeptidase [Bdellovibrio sp.]